MALNKISSEVVEINVDNYIESAFKAGASLSDLGWSSYADTASVNPVDGLGGSPNLTISLNTSSPLSGDADLRISKDAANRQGQGIGYNFNIENRHLGKVLQISFDTELISGNYENPILTSTAGTYTITSTTVCTVTASHSFVAGQVVNMTFTSGTRPVDGFYTIVSVTATTFVITVASGSATNATCSYTVPADLRVSIIQNPSGTPVVIEPVNTSIQLGIANQRIRHIASFQTHISITSYRLCIHVSSASTVAYTVDFANFKVWEPTQSIGAVITDWQSYTPTFTQQNGSTLPNITPNTFLWRRVGDSIEILGRFSVTGSLGTYIDINFNLPNGLQFKYLTPPPPMPFHYGTGLFIGGGGSSQPVITKLDPISNGRLRIQYQTSVTTIVFGQFTNSTYTGANGDHFTFETISIPIAGWGSNVAMSSDSGDGRVVAARYTNGSSATVSTLIPFHFNTLSYDTHNGITKGTAGSSMAFFYIAPISGYYRISCCVGINSTSGVSIFVNDVDNILMGQGTNGILTNYSGQVFLNAGQKVDIRPNSSSFTSVSNANNFFSIERISAGSQTIGVNETVACSVSKTSGSASTSTRIASWNTKDVDTHNSFDLTTGIFTVPSSGIYLINAASNILGNFTTYNQPGFTIRNGNTILSLSTMYFTSSFEPELSVSALRRFVAGDIISLFGYGSGFACNNLIMNISRIGI